MAMTSERPTCRPMGRYCQAQAAAIMGVSRQTIRRWTNLGKLKASVGKDRLYYRGRDLLQYWDKH